MAALRRIDHLMEASCHLVLDVVCVGVGRTGGNYIPVDRSSRIPGDIRRTTVVGSVVAVAAEGRAGSKSV